MFLYSKILFNQLILVFQYWIILDSDNKKEHKRIQWNTNQSNIFFFGSYSQTLPKPLPEPNQTEPISTVIHIKNLKKHKICITDND